MIGTPVRLAPRRMYVREGIAALPDLGLACAYLIAWIDPTLLPLSAFSYLLGILLLEGVIIQSSAFLSAVYVSRASRGSRAVSLIALGVAFTALVWLVASRFHARWMIGAFWLLTANKLMGVIVGHDREDSQRAFVLTTWFSGFAVYGAVMVLAAAVRLPALGTPLVTPDPVPLASGWWRDGPQQYLAAGFAYYCFMALSDLTGYAWFDRLVRRLFSWVRPGWDR